MAGGDGGWDPGSYFRNMVSNPIDTIASAIINYGTFGLVGYEDGGLKAGVATKAVDEGLGEITGRNQMRKIAMDQQAAINAERLARDEERAGQIRKQENQERQASMAGSGSRRSTGSNGIGDTERRMESDFLGL